MSLSENIKKFRELNNFTQDYMAKQLGITQAGYSKIEKGQTDVAYSKIVEISKVLSVSPEDLIAFDTKRFFNSFNIKGNNSGYITTVLDVNTEDLKKLYEDKIKLLEKLLHKSDEELTRYKDRFGDV